MDYKSMVLSDSRPLKGKGAYLKQIIKTIHPIPIVKPALVLLDLSQWPMEPEAAVVAGQVSAGNDLLARRCRNSPDNIIHPFRHCVPEQLQEGRHPPR
jgi:hypothetical protein